jgi:hypothetical protein
LKTGIFRAPLIQIIINKVWFKNKDDDGVIHPEFSENDMLPMATVAFVLTLVSFNFRLFLFNNPFFRSKITLTSGSLANISTSLSLLQPTRRNTVPTSNVLRILRRKPVRRTSSLVSSDICSRLLGVSILNRCHHDTYFSIQKACQSFRRRGRASLKHFRGRDRSCKSGMGGSGTFR